MSFKKSGAFAIKLLVTGAILAFLFSIVDIQEVSTAITTIPVWTFLVVIGGYFTALFFGTVRWSILLSAQGIRIPLSHLLAYNFSWMFYSIALPGGKLGAEAIRIFQILADTKDVITPREKIVIASLMDRVIAILALALVALPFFIVMRETIIAEFSPFVGALAAIGFVGLIALAFVPFEFFFRPFLRFMPPTVASVVSSMGGVLTAYRRRPFLFASTLILSFLMNLALAGGLFVITTALGIPVSFFELFSVFCISMLAAIVPFTIGGIGVREGTLVFLVSTISGASLTLSLSASLIMLGASLAVAAIGGVVEFYRHYLRS